jgi:hypothetical protein
MEESSISINMFVVISIERRRKLFEGSLNSLLIQARSIVPQAGVIHAATCAVQGEHCIFCECSVVAIGSGSRARNSPVGYRETCIEVECSGCFRARSISNEGSSCILDVLVNGDKSGDFVLDTACPR